jgi:2-polyprenyl-3-methyl-5-hydroxy-6-metoxy-1,4-benzoquinol methylase
MHDKHGACAQQALGSTVGNVGIAQQRQTSRLPPSVTHPLESIWTIDLSERRRMPEWMDQPDVDPQALHAALVALDQYNQFSGTHRLFWKRIRQLAAGHQNGELRVLDVACGGGEIALKLAGLARSSNLNVAVDGCDLSPTAVAVATERAVQNGLGSRFFQFDVTRDDWPTDYDVICSSLFLHHLPTPMAGSVLSDMGRAARQMVLINDLIRSRLGYVILRIGTLLVTRSALARYDGPVSVAGAFTAGDLQQMADRAGLVGAKISRCWPERMLLEWKKR